MKSYSQIPAVFQLLAVDYAANSAFAVWKTFNPCEETCAACVLGR